MRRLQKLISVTLIAAAAGNPGLAPGADAADAEAVVAGLQAALVEVAAIEPAPDMAMRRTLLAPVIIAAHDFEQMGRLTVRRFWRDFSPAERQEFLDVFEHLSVTTYASRFAAIGPDAFEITGVETLAENRAEVLSLIHRPDDAPVSMNYTLQFDGEAWRIVNVLADGASELSLMAAEYYEILESGELDDLIAELESRIAELGAGQER